MKLIFVILTLALLLSACIERRLPETHPRASGVTVNSGVIVSLKVAEPNTTVKYDRKAWRHWTDDDNDCLNTRHEVLESESLVPVTYTSSKCAVASGRWLGQFTGKIYESSRSLDVDHMVPLANAHRSGGWAWDSKRKEQYANDMSTEESLIAVSASANRQKSDKGPDAWKPKNVGYHCQYAKDWIAIKGRWDLTITAAEQTALQEMLGMC